MKSVYLTHFRRSITVYLFSVLLSCVAVELALPADCIECHGKRGLSMEIAGVRKVSPFVDSGVLEAGVHGELRCQDCHGEGYAEVPHPEGAPAADCAQCHEDQREIVASGAHGPAAAPEVSCASCHGYHGILAPADSGSVVSPLRVSHTCGRCHPSAEAGYEKSVHGVAREHGIEDAPSCTGCHGSHSILSSSDPVSTVYAGNVPATCSKCHAEERITTRYGLASNRLETYENSYHGIANRYGEVVVANCASCHGVHRILPSSDPASSIAPENRAATCGKCHIGAGENFAKGKIHVEATKESSRGMFYVRRFYTWLIAILVAFFAVHIAMDVAGYRRRRRSKAEGEERRTPQA